MIGIYKIENLINHKVYIGQSVQLSTRWRNHKNSVYNSSLTTYEYPLYRAMRKYGLDNFAFSIIEECSEDELDERECYWIKKYGSFGAKGYNQTAGGSGKPRVLPSEVCKLFNEGWTIQELCDYYEVKSITIKNILHPLGLGYLTQDEKNQLQPTCRAVEQYDLEGNYIHTYYSAHNAAKAVSSTRETIQSACFRYSITKNFIWKFQDDINSIEIILQIQVRRREEKAKSVRTAVLKRCSKKVNQYTLGGQYITTFPSAAEAARAVNKHASGITYVCRGERHQAYNYIWKYVSEDFPEGQNLNIGGKEG